MKFLIDSHVHSLSSGHAYATIYENIIHAKKLGLEAIAITDHAPEMPGTCHLFHFNNLKVIPKVVEGVRVFTGIELNILDVNGKIDAPEYTLKMLDVKIASIHEILNDVDGIENITKTYVNTIKNNNINVIGHPCDIRYPFNIEEVVLAAKEHNVAFEINNCSLNKTSYRYDPDESIIDLLMCCKKHNVFVTCGSDSHYLDTLGNFDNTYELLSRIDFPEKLILNANLQLFEDFVQSHKNK
ncbi:MAG: phosphatase [Lachnospirales bacterium]